MFSIAGRSICGTKYDAHGQAGGRADRKKMKKKIPGKIWFDLAPISFLVLLAAATAALLSGCVALLLTADGGVLPPLLVPMCHIVCP